jgi:tRNA pseudouridine55 synthase
MAKELDAQINEVINLYKERSETPLQTIERYVKAHPEFKGSKMTYAGRLDPMAEGVLIILSGEKNKERDLYTGLDKDYEFEFVLGVDTDTHDVLGKIVAASGSSAGEEDVRKALEKYTGKFIQKYPAYSSKVVDGVPLFDLARRGKIGTVVMPEHEVTVSYMELIGSRTVSREDLKDFIEKTIAAVKGDFRQAEILKAWRACLETAPESFTIYKAKVTCGSGFYVRQLVSDIGRDLGTGAVTISILRTRVGEYLIKDSIK